MARDKSQLWPVSSLLIAVLAGCATVASVEPRRIEPIGQPALDKIVRRYHDAGDFDGLVVVRRGGRVVYRTAIGEADRSGHVAHELDELFPLASLTKQVTALLVMQQVELGALGLDVAIGAYLPMIDNASRAITVRQLLQHTSGLPNPNDGAPEGTVPAFYVRTGLEVGDHALVLHTVCGGAPTPPGTFSYALDVPGRQPVQLVERQGSIGGIRLLSLVAPRDNVAIEILANTERAPLFELWARRGLPFDLVLAVFGAPSQ